jgi:hypothetical protein
MAFNLLYAFQMALSGGHKPHVVSFYIIKCIYIY